MLRFLIRRIAQGILVLLMVTVLVFGIFFAGGNRQTVAARLAGRNATQATVNMVKARLHLNQPLYLQYWYFLKQLVWHHNLGYSYYHSQPVSTILKQAIPITLVAGRRRHHHLAGTRHPVRGPVGGAAGDVPGPGHTTLALFFYSMPTFVLGLLLLFFVYVSVQKRGIRVSRGRGTCTSPTSPIKWFESLVLPWFTLALVSAATYTRLTRNTLLEVLGEDYIRTARAKGLTERRVVFRHGLRSSLTPVASQLGIDMGTLVGGAIVTETVFGLPGLGYTAVWPSSNSDLPVIIGIVIMASTAVVVAQILVDIGYAVLDPRVRLH